MCRQFRLLFHPHKEREREGETVLPPSSLSLSQSITSFILHRSSFHSRHFSPISSYKEGPSFLTVTSFFSRRSITVTSLWSLHYCVYSHFHPFLPSFLVSSFSLSSAEKRVKKGIRDSESDREKGRKGGRN